jgi:hypothetical protein
MPLGRGEVEKWKIKRDKKAVIQRKIKSKMLQCSGMQRS